MDTDDGLRLDYNMKQLLHDLISGEMSGVLPMEISRRLSKYVKPDIISEFLNLRILNLINYEAYFKAIENYLQFVLDQNTDVSCAMEFINEEICDVQDNLARGEKDLIPEIKSVMESYVLALKCLTRILPNIKPKETLPVEDILEDELNEEIAKIFVPNEESTAERAKILHKLKEMDKLNKQSKNPKETPQNMFSIEYASEYLIKYAKGITNKVKEIRKWQKLIPWKQKRILEILLNSRNVPWKSYYNNNSTSQILLGNLADVYNINFSFGIYWENLSTKINNKLINFIKINSIMEAEADDFKHNTTGFKYNNLIKPRINLTKEANKIKDYEIQVLHAINHGNEENLEQLWNNELRNNLDERVLIEFTKMKEYMQEQKLMRKYLEEQVKQMKSKSNK